MRADPHRVRTRPGPSRLLLAAVLFGGNLAAACANTPFGPRTYSQAELVEGEIITAGGSRAAVVSTTMFLATGATWHTAAHDQLERSGVAVVDAPASAGFDAVVLYRDGPYCGLLPRVEVHGDQTALEVLVLPRRRSWNFDDMEYDAAIGLDLHGPYEQADITAVVD